MLCDLARGVHDDFLVQRRALSQYTPFVEPLYAPIFPRWTARQKAIAESHALVDPDRIQVAYTQIES